jgi:hypothetical protein
MNVKEIIIAHLKAGGFDGLACDGCGCGIDDGLMDCVNEYSLCQPAKRHDCAGICSQCAGDGPANYANNCYRVAEQPTNKEETHL